MVQLNIISIKPKLQTKLNKKMNTEDSDKSISKYIALYCFAFLAHGLFSCNVGPLIPYLSDLLEKNQTEFSFLFMARTIGSIIGIVAYRILLMKSKYTNEHKVLAFFSSVSAVSMIIFLMWQTILGEWVIMIVIGVGTFGVITLANVCILFISQRDPKWLSFGHGFFGIGALLAPIIIMGLELNMFYLNFVFYGSLALLSLYIPNPSHQVHDQIKSEGDSVRSSQMTRASERRQQPQFKQGSFQLEVLLSLSLFMIVALQTTLIGWMPSYAVLSGVCDKDEAGLYVTIFWIMSTLGRFINGAVKTRSSLKLKIMLGSILFSGVVCLVLDLFGHTSSAALIGSFLFGISCSGVYPTIFAVPTQYGIKFKKEQTTNMISSTILTGLLTGFTGMLMKIRVDFLFYALIFMGLLQLICAAFVFKISIRDANVKRPEKVIEIQDYLIQ